MKPIKIIANQIELVDVDDLIPYANNAKKHPAEQIARLCGIIREFGWTQPILIGADGGIIAGHGRVMAARKLEMDRVPCIRATDLTPTQIKALILADNKIGETGWEVEMLKVEIESLNEDDPDLLAFIGFSAEEMEALCADLEDVEDFSGGDGEAQGEAKVSFLTFGSKRMEITEREIEVLTKKLATHMDLYGVPQGFVTRTLLPAEFLA
jgi:ParB-like chromosome segregation protein Spo0J